MKLKIILLTIVGLFLFATSQPAIAVTSSSNFVSAEVIGQEKKASKQQIKAQKKRDKIERLLHRAGIDLQDPIRKWMWYCIFSIVASAAFFVLLLIAPSALFVILTNLALLVALITGIMFLVKNNTH
jgi:hypothetical protein